MLHGPALLHNGIEFSVHECPKALRRELLLVLPGVDLTNVTLVVTCQRAAMDLVNVGPDVAVEKDALLEKVGHQRVASMLFEALEGGYTDLHANLNAIGRTLCVAASLQFVSWASSVVDSLTANGYWGDYVDPCSGAQSMNAYPAT